MAIQNVSPYLQFDGNAEKAIALYERALGAEREFFMRFREAPQPCPGTHADRVMHACVRVGDHRIMISDAPANVPALAAGAQISLDFDDASDMAARFDALASGGKVTVPLHDAFWGAKFGMLIDAFGVHWMFNCQKH